MSDLPPAENIVIRADDGQALAGMLYRPALNNEAIPKAPVLVAGALGIEQRYYSAFCNWLAQRGHLVMSFDLRGMGASLPAGGSVRDVQADMLLWARVDFAAAVRTLCELSGQAQIAVVGHSLGAQHAGMGLPQTQKQIRQVIAVASGMACWRDWQTPSRRAAPWMLYLAGPLLTPLFGYFPGKRIGMVGNLPKGVMQQFSRWCKHPQFAWGAEPEKVLPSLAGASYPIHAISFTDDEAMTEACTRQLLAAHSNAQCSLEIIQPSDVGVKRIGHIGAFRREMASSLWPLIIHRINQLSQK
jgi:predicted alpha/beta hydrolase